MAYLHAGAACKIGARNKVGVRQTHGTHSALPADMHDSAELGMNPQMRLSCAALELL